MSKVKRAMILAAGMGERLRPITDKIPKPMIPVLDKPLIAHTLTLLRNYGIEEVMINLHHLAGVIRAMLGDGSAYGVKISYSSEPELLGTGGGVKKVESFFADETFIVLNGDILCDVNLDAAIAEHRAKGAMATMVVRDRDYERFGLIEVNKEGRVERILNQGPKSDDLTPAMFTGVHVLEPEFLGHVPQGPGCIIRTAYLDLIASGGPIYTYWHEGYWNDLGSPARYLSATMALLHGRASLEHIPIPETVSSEAKLNGKVRVKPPVVIGNNVIIGANSKIGPDVVIGDAATVEAESSIRESIVFPGAVVKGDIKEAIITPWCTVQGVE
jgi:NDP-sugar pyrophosphorylase family protein